MLCSLHTDVLVNNDEIVVEPPLKKIKTEEIQDDQPGDTSPTPLPLPKTQALRKLESNEIRVYAPSPAKDNKIRICVFGLNPHYAGFDANQGYKAGFFDPIYKFLMAHPKSAAELLRIVDCLFACEPGNSDTVRKADPDKSTFYAWKLYIVHKKENETLEELQKDVTSRIIHYANTHLGEGPLNFKRVPEFCTGSIENEDLQLPWNHYFQNKSVLRFMKRYYSHNSRHDIMANPDVLKRYFGTFDEGVRHLTMSDLDWMKL